jgi:hypothetical protein
MAFGAELVEQRFPRRLGGAADRGREYAETGHHKQCAHDYFAVR